MKVCKHKSGLDLYYSDYFTARGNSSVKGVYKSYVAVKGYDFGKINIWNLDILTPAQQYLFEETSSMKYNLTKRAENWLIKHVGPRGDLWDCDTNGIDLFFASIFFKNRNEALKLVRHINDVLYIKKNIFLD